jgi:hypothetical protein
MEINKANRAKTLSLLRRMLHEMEQGYDPEYMAICYPLPNEKEVIQILGFTSVRNAFNLHERLNDMDNNLHEEAIRRKTGLTSEEMDDIEDQFKRDMTDVVGRLVDRLTPDEPITDFKDAQKILGEIMSRTKKS